MSEEQAIAEFRAAALAHPQLVENMRKTTEFLREHRRRKAMAALEAQRAALLGDDDTAESFPAALSALRDATGLSLRALAPRVGKSPATLSRIFSGKMLPTRSVLIQILEALGAPAAAGQKVMALWREATRTTPGPAKTAPSATVPPDGPETPIVVHGGSITFNDGKSTMGRTIVVHDGNVTLSTEAARAARQIVVHGGSVNVGDPPSLPQPEEGINQDPPTLPEAGRHLRRVS